MTNNDAAKALDRLRHTISMYDGIDDDYETIRTALTKSAKVDGLLEAINEVLSSGDYADNSAASIILKKAIQCFNGEV